MGCWDDIKAVSGNIVSILESRTGIKYDPETKIGRDEYLKAVEELRNETVESLADVHNQIADFSGKEKPFGIKAKEKIDDVTETVKPFIADIKGELNKNIFKGDTNEALKYVSDQWHDEGSRATTENTFPQEIIDLAKDKFPQETQKSLTAQPKADVPKEGKNIENEKIKTEASEETQTESNKQEEQKFKNAYRDLTDNVIKTFTDAGISEDAAHKTWQRMLPALVNGDNISLSKMLHKDNKIARKVFENITGRKFGKDITQAQISESKTPFINNYLNRISQSETSPIEGKKPDVVVDKKAETTETEKTKPLDTVPSIENKNIDLNEITYGVIGKVGKFISRLFGGKASEKVYIAKDTNALMDKAGELETSKDRVQFMFKEAFIGAVAMLQPMTLKNSAVVRTEQVSKILSKDEKSVIDILNNYYKENDETPPKDVIDRALYLWDKFGGPEIVGDSTKNNERAFAVKGEKTLLGNITNFDDFIAELSHAAQYISGKKLDDKQYDTEAQRDSLEYKRKGSTEYNAHQLIEPILAKYIFSGDSSQLNKIAYQNKDGKILGFTHNGKIYLNGEHLNPETPIHEAGHIWAEWVKQNDSKVYSKGIELINGSKYLKAVKENKFYEAEAAKLPIKEREEFYQQEALATAIGDKGAQFVSESRQKGFKQWLNNLWSNIKNAAGFKDISNMDFQNLTLDEFSKRAAADILREQPVDTVPSILNQEKDLKGNKKEIWMNPVGNEGVQIDKLRKQAIKLALAEVEDVPDTLFKQAIDDGRMTANDAKAIIESAGLEVPKDILETKNEPSKTKEKPIPSFHKKVDDVADSLIKALSAKLPEGTKKQGVGDIATIIRAAADIIKKAYDLKTDIKKAIDEAVAYVKKQFADNNLGDVDENIIREHFENQEIIGETPPPKPPVDNVTEGKEDDGRGIKHASTAELRSKYNLGSYERDNATDAELEDLADIAIREGYDPEALIRQMESGTPPTGVENFIIKKYLATLEAKFDKNPSDENLAPIERLVKATDKIGSLQSEAFRTRKGLVPVDNSLAGYFITEKELNLDAPLTDGQKTQVKKEFADITEAQKKYEDKLAALQAENDKMRADLELKKEVLKKSKTKRTHEDFVNERRDILNDIKAKLKKARGETNVTPIPYAKELVTIAPDVAKLVRNLVEEGVTKLSDIVADIHDSLKDSIKGITTQDVYAIIAGDYKESKQTKNEISKQIFDLKTEAQLIGKYEKLKEGIEPKNEKEKIKHNQELEKLRKQIKEDDLSKLAVYKSQTKARIAKLEDDLAKGKYESDQKPPSVKLDKEAVALKDKYIKLKNERHFRLLLHQHRNKTKWEKAIHAATEILNVPRTLMTIVDYSAVLRQGIIQVINHPGLVFNLKKSGGKIKVGGAAIEMFKAGASQKIYDRWFYNLKETPRYEIMEQSKLGVTDSTSPLLAAREEDFMSSLAEKIPIIGKSLTIGKVKIPGTNIVKGSERSYSMFLNKLRVDLFNRFADAMEERGATFENSPEAYKQMAEYINNSTGRGSLGKTLNKIAPVLNALFFSPRLIASRLNMLTYLAQPRFYSTVPKEVRRDYFIGMAKFIALGSTVVGLAALSGDDEDDITVETDPRSSDVGKIKHKNTRWDIWGGFQPYIRVAAQAISGDRKTASGEIQELSGDKPFGQTKGSVIINFLRSKLAPVPGMAVDFYTGETIIGEKLIYETREPGAKEIMVGTYIKEHLLPLTYTGISEAMKDQGVKALFTVGVPSVFGVGTQTYEASKAKFQTITIKNPKTFKERPLTVEEDKKYRATIAKDVPLLLKKFTSNEKTIWEDVNGKIHLSKEGGNITNAEKKTWKSIKSNKLSEEQRKDLEDKVKDKVSRSVEKTIKF